jgi:hypothetical protein
MTTTNATNPWSFITTPNTWFKHDYDKQKLSMIIHGEPSILCVMNDHGYVAFVVVIVEPSIMCGNEWSWICCICGSYSWTIIHYYTEYLDQPWLRQTEHIHDHSLPHRILGSTMTTTNGTYPWSFITTQNTWINHDYDKRNISMIIHYHTEYFVVMNDHGYVAFVVVIVEPSIMCGNEWSWICFACRTYPWSFITTQNTWFNYDYDKRNISMIIHYHTEYLVQTWLRQTKHIHDHSLPLNQIFCVVMNDHGYVPFVLLIVEPSILCGNEWSWICFVCRSHSWTKYSVW